jgi:histidine phosphotransferase ChpT
MTAAMTGIDLASLLCSRLCHDLVSPIGALSNGVEILADEEDATMRAQALTLLEDSARTAANRLKFFRLAFGSAGGYDSEIDVREVRAAIEGLVGGGRVEIIWQVAEATLPKAAVRVLLNLALIGGEALLRGGSLTVGARRESGAVRLMVAAEGPKVLVGEDTRAALEARLAADQITPRVVPAYLVQTLLSGPGGRLMCSAAGEPGFTAHAELAVAAVDLRQAG